MLLGILLAPLGIGVDGLTLALPGVVMVLRAPLGIGVDESRFDSTAWRKSTEAAFRGGGGRGGGYILEGCFFWKTSMICLITSKSGVADINITANGPHCQSYTTTYHEH